TFGVSKLPFSIRLGGVGEAPLNTYFWLASGTAGALSRNWFGFCEERLTILAPGMTPGPVPDAPMTRLAQSSGRRFKKASPAPAVTRLRTLSGPVPPEHCRNEVGVVPV